MAVGRKETNAAKSRTVTVANRWRRMTARKPWINELNGLSGANEEAWGLEKNRKTRIAQGRSKGRLLAFAPVKRAAASREQTRSESRRVSRARSAKSMAASAYNAGNVSFPVLAA